VLSVSASDGCDAAVLRVGEGIGEARRGPAVAEQLERGREVTYATYLMWRGLLDREPPRRPDPERPAGPPAARAEAWKFAFVGSRCLDCGHVHVPPRRVCVGCRAVDRMERAPLADRQGTVATHTIDRLAFSPSPPMIDAVVDFDGGGRYTLEVADAVPDEVDIGTRLELTFRRLYTTAGIHKLLLEGEADLMASHGIKDQVAIVGMGCTRFGSDGNRPPTTCSSTQPRSASPRPRRSGRTTSTPTGSGR